MLMDILEVGSRTFQLGILVLEGSSALSPCLHMLMTTEYKSRRLLYIMSPTDESSWRGRLKMGRLVTIWKLTMILHFP